MKIALCYLVTIAAAELVVALVNPLGGIILHIMLLLSCAIERLAVIEEARSVLKEAVNRYNNHQVHSATREWANPGATRRA